MRLSDQLDVPLRERNELLLAGGYAPAYPQHSIDEPELASVRAALTQVLRGHEPYPAVVIDRWWNLVDANAALAPLTAGCAAHLLEQPQRPSAEPAPGRARAAHRQSRPVARAPARAAAPPQRAHRRSATRRARGRAARLPRRRRRRARTDAVSCCRCGYGVDGRELALFSIEARVGHADRRHGRRAVDRDVLSRRRRHRRLPTPSERAVGTVRAQPRHHSTVAHHRCAVVVPVVVLATRRAVVLDEFVDRRVVGRGRHLGQRRPRTRAPRSARSRRW